MTARRELAAFAVGLGALVAGLLGESLFGGKVLSPADVLFVSASFRGVKGADYEPANRLLTDPVLQFQPWLEFNRAMLRRGRLPLWNDLAGCGTPHLANGQSAVFDPVHLIAYLGTLPWAHAWMAAARLWLAGVGMFLLARSWGLGVWGRWFAGLTFPLSGFVIVWLLYTVTAVAVWMPWLFWATERVLQRPGPRRVGVLAAAVACVFFGGHVQTSAYVLLAAGVYAAWWSVRRGRDVRPPLAWSLGVGLGLGVAAVSVVPLWVYLGKSPVWADREKERPSPLRLATPRALDAVCTAVPYAFGSQRRGHPNLARAVGVHNLNESAGGFAGLATLLWLAPQAWLVRRDVARVRFLSALAAFGFLGAFGFPPVANLLRAAPVLNVTDHRRLTLWVSFALVVLGGIGLDAVAAPWPRRVGRGWVGLWVVAALALAAAAPAVRRAEPWLRDRAVGHYTRAAATTAGADPAAYQRRADRQVRGALEHVPRQLGRTACELSAMAALAALARRGVVPWPAARGVLLGLTVFELFGFGFGLNPAIDPVDDRPVTAVVTRLRDLAGRGGRVLGVGEELPPNVAMRYGLADPRNYDSVELSRSVDWFEPLYEPDPRGRTSRRAVTWSGVLRARERLREAGVVAVVAATPPPAPLAARSERVGAAWLARLDAEPLVTAGAAGVVTSWGSDHGRIHALVNCSREETFVFRWTHDPGWRATVDGRPAAVLAGRGGFLSLRVGRGSHRVSLVYDPPEARAACAASLVAAAATVLALTGFRSTRSRRFSDEGLGRSEAVGLKSGHDLRRNC